MRYAALLAFGVLVVPAARSHAQMGVSADLGLAAIMASSPYSSSLAGIGRAGFSVQLADRFLAEVEGQAFGTLLAGDAYVPNERALPNTLGVSLGIVRMIDGRERLALSAGIGVYRVASRAQAVGGDGFGVHAGATAVLVRRGRAAFTIGLRAMLLPDIGDSHIWALPLTAGVRLR